MHVAVAGLWHLGCVTAASVAAGGHTVTGIDFDAAVIDGLRDGRAPLFEPGLDDLIAVEAKAGRLTFSEDAAAV